MKLKTVIVAMGLSVTALLMADQDPAKEPAKTTEETSKPASETAKAETKAQPEAKSGCSSCKG
jgi:hypothetical protein